MKRTIFIIALSLLVIPMSGNAQNTRKVFKTASSVAKQFRSFDISGTWIYAGIDVQFESSGLLKKAGGMVAANKIESMLDNQLSAIGFEEGVTIFRFAEDGTFTNTTRERTLSGTYDLDRDKGTITLRYLGKVPVKAHISTSSNSISLLFQSDGMLSVASFIGGNSGVGVLKTAGSVIDGYDGMLTGIKLVKQ